MKLDFDYTAALKGLEESGKKILAEAKDLAESEKDIILRALLEVANFQKLVATGTTPSLFSTSCFMTAKATIARYEEIALLVLKDWTDDFLKDLGAGAAKAGKVFLGSLAGSFGIPVHLQ